MAIITVMHTFQAIRKHRRCVSYLAFILLGFLTVAAGTESLNVSQKKQPTFGEPSTPMKVKRVISGSSLELADGRKVRLIGVNDMSDSNASQESTRLGIEIKHLHELKKRSKKMLENFAKNKEVILITDLMHEATQFRDKHGHLLAYVYGVAKTDSQINMKQVLWVRRYEKLSDNKNHLNINATLIESGNAVLDNTYPFSVRDMFLKLQEDAKKKRRAVWNPNGFDDFF